MSCERFTWRVGDDLECTLTVRIRGGVVGPASLSWSPSRPPRLSGASWADFRRGRAMAMAEIRERFGAEPEIIKEAA